MFKNPFQYISQGGKKRWFISTDKTFKKGEGFKSGFEANSLLKPQWIVLHWGGLNLNHCFNTLKERGLSTHFGVEGKEVNQWLDLEHKAYHVGSWNSKCIGVDICQSPQTKHHHHYPHLPIIQNQSGRGDRQVVDVDPITADTAWRLVQELCRICDILFEWPVAEDTLGVGRGWHGVLSRDFLRNKSGVIGHHHLKESKWDIACWWDQVFLK